jgi:hypothetical protein
MYEREVRISASDISLLVALLAGRICSRCKLYYGDHAGADHLFFDDPFDLDYDELN